MWARDGQTERGVGVDRRPFYTQVPRERERESGGREEKRKKDVEEKIRSAEKGGRPVVYGCRPLRVP